MLLDKELLSSEGKSVKNQKETLSSPLEDNRSLKDKEIWLKLRLLEKEARIKE